jgi:outer membrane protein assembly factor BamB
MSRKFARLLSGFAVILVGTATAGDWPGFRGPHGNGTSEDRDLPIKWSADENVAWKARLPGPGASSPTTWKNHIFLTCWTGYGETKGGSGELAKLRRHLLCLDRKTGKLLWDRDVPAKLPENEYKTQVTQHGYTTSTPVTDGERVYVFFGKSGVFAFDLSGKELWHAEAGKGFNVFGSGSSPILFRNLVLINATVECSALLALDRVSGKVVWRAKVYGDTWSTPVVVETAGGKPEIVLSAQSAVLAFDPDDGKQLWECDHTGSDYASASPLARKDTVYVMGAGFGARLFTAIRSGGRGDVTKTHVLWQQKVGAAYCSPILVGEYLYYFSGGQAVCLRAATGEIVFRDRLSGVGQEYASPVAADGKIYLFTRSGVAHVLAAKDRLESLARNDLGDDGSFVASPAISDGQLLVRTHQYLYCIGKSR